MNKGFCQRVIGSHTCLCFWAPSKQLWNSQLFYRSSSVGSKEGEMTCSNINISCLSPSPIFMHQGRNRGQTLEGGREESGCFPRRFNVAELSSLALQPPPYFMYCKLAATELAKICPRCPRHSYLLRYQGLGMTKQKLSLMRDNGACRSTNS